MRVRPAVLSVLVSAAAPFGHLQAQTLDEVVVEGRYTSELTLGKTVASPREIPNSVSVITERRIADQNMTTLADALVNATGVTVVPNNRTQSQYRSRGYPLSVMNDGVPAYSSLSGYEQLDLSMYERIEVLRGPAGLLQGSGEPGGTVNLVRKHAQQDFAGNVAVTASRWHDYRGVVDLGGPLNDGRSLRARAVASYEDADDFIEFGRSSHHFAYGTMEWLPTAATRLAISVVDQDSSATADYAGLPSWASGEQLRVPRSTNSAPPWQRSRGDLRDYSVDVNHRAENGWSLSVRGSRRRQGQFFHDAYPADGVRDDYTIDYIRREYDYDYDRRAADVFVTGPVSLFGRTHTMLFGYNSDGLDTHYSGMALNARDELTSIAFDRRAQLPDFSLPHDEGGATETRQSGFYALARLTVTDSVKLLAGARLSDFNVRSRSLPPGVASAWRQGQRADDEVTPFGGVLFDVSKWLTLYASYSSIFVPQTQLRTDGTPLDPRVGHQVEVGGKATFLEGRLNASVALFDLRDTGRALPDPAARGFSLNAGEVESKGWELEITGSPRAGLELQAGYSRLDAHFVVAAPAMQGRWFSVFEPEHSWRFWVVQRLGEHDDSGFTVGVGCNGQSATMFDEPRRQGSYTLLNALAGYRFSRHLSVNINASNLLDEVYYARLGDTNSYNTFGEPRNYSVTVRSSF